MGTLFLDSAIQEAAAASGVVSGVTTNPAILDSMPEQVLDGCRRLATMLLVAANPPAHVPASEFSDLTATWRHDQGR